MIRVKRNYRAWVANETLEDYSLRYAAKSYRRWPSLLLANTALGGISFLALEAIGGAITISYGFANAIPAILVVCVLIFVTGLPITYYSSRYNIDMDLLTRGAGFGYIGSTITSLIYASFTFIFFALEAAIMAQALELYFGLPIVLGYIVCSLIILPITFFGVTLINQLQLWSQPIWLVLLVLPFLFIFAKEPEALREWTNFAGRSEEGSEFDLLLFFAATGVLFSLFAQIGEQVDYLRFLPERKDRNRRTWKFAMLSAGPGWIVVGGLKILAGSFLAFEVVKGGGSIAEAIEPIRMYIKAYAYVFTDPQVVLTLATAFVVISQVKINVTNAYAGSLAWANFFSRVTHYHPGRVIWLVFNVLIALLLMLLGIFETLEAVLSVYSIIVAAWIGAIVADLVALKPLGISPPYVEFKRAHLYDFNPVGCGSMLIASVLSILCYSGVFGELARVSSSFISLGTAFIAALCIGIGTRGRYYIAREDVSFRNTTTDLVTCCICLRQYEPDDMAQCPFYSGPICSLCCTLDTHCHDVCKAPDHLTAIAATAGAPSLEQPRFQPSITRRVGRFFGLFSVIAIVTGGVFLLSLRLIEAGSPEPLVGLPEIFLRLYAAGLGLIAVGAWWIVLSHESRELAESELVNSLHFLELTQQDLVQSEKMASLGRLVAGVAHETSTPIGITVSAASFLRDRVIGIRKSMDKGPIKPEELRAFLADAEDSARLLLSNAKRAADLIQSFKQVAVDRTSEERRLFNLHDFLQDTLDSLRPKLKKTLHHFSIRAPAGEFVDSYAGPLAQVVTNLVLNCVGHAFTDDRPGNVTLEANLNRAGVLEIKCADDGVGISEDVLPKIFEPFYTTKRGEGGSGLGLHVVYNIVTETLGGSVHVESTPGIGTVFVVAIPHCEPRRLPHNPDGQGHEGAPAE